MFKSIFCSLAAASILAGASSVTHASGRHASVTPNLLSYASSPPAELNRVSEAHSTRQVSVSEHFKPRPNETTKLEYKVWSQILGHFVVNVGPSIRVRTKPYERRTGTRFKSGKNEPYRLETNKVLYPFIRPQVRDYIADYADELEALGSQIDIPALERDQQLAYWINLHNAVVVREISKHYPGPKRRPRDIMPSEGSAEGLHRATLLTIDGVELSLNDIRQRIVYPHWKNPDVAFGFYLGDVGSPSLRYQAYEPFKVARQLKSNSEQYVNSLLGMEKGKVSRIYQEIAPWYFQNFESDLAAYFKKRMRPEVFAEYEQRGYRGISKYQDYVNDITSGRGRGRVSAAPLIDGQNPASSHYSIEIHQFRKEAVAKVLELRKKDWYVPNRVIVEELATE